VLLCIFFIQKKKTDIEQLKFAKEQDFLQRLINNSQTLTEKNRTTLFNVEMTKKNRKEKKRKEKKRKEKKRKEKKRKEKKRK
jgi:hypothetical protein